MAESLQPFAVGVGIGGAIGSTTFSSGAAKAAAASVDAVRIATQVSRELHDHWKAYYQVCDALTIAEVCAVPIYVAPATTIAGRTRLEVIRTIGRKRQELYRSQGVYNVGKMAQDCNTLAAIEAQAALDASEWGFRKAQNLEIQRNQRRLENIYAFQALGRNLLNNSLGAAALSGAIGAQLGAEQGKAFAGWTQFLGVLFSKEGQSAISGISKGLEAVQVEIAARQGYVSDAEQAAAGGLPFGAEPSGAGFATEPEYGSTFPLGPTAFGQGPPDVGAQEPSTGSG